MRAAAAMEIGMCRPRARALLLGLAIFTPMVNPMVIRVEMGDASRVDVAVALETLGLGATRGEGGNCCPERKRVAGCKLSFVVGDVKLRVGRGQTILLF